MITKIRKAGGNTPSLQATIPKSILEVLGWEEGDRIIWNIEEDKSCVYVLKKY